MPSGITLGSGWSRENPEPADPESARRPDPQRAAVVVVDPDRAQGGAEAHGRPADMEPRDQPTDAEVDPVVSSTGMGQCSEMSLDGTDPCVETAHVLVVGHRSADDIARP